MSELLLQKRAMTADMAARGQTDPHDAGELAAEPFDLWELERDEKRYRDIEPIAA